MILNAFVPVVQREVQRQLQQRIYIFFSTKIVSFPVFFHCNKHQIHLNLIMALGESLYDMVSLGLMVVRSEDEVKSITLSFMTEV